jgi:class 3 adenylate cyclase
MALWDGPNLRENIHQALKTAIAINTFTSNLGKKVPDLPWPLQIGAALNTGEAMLGNLAQDGQSNYTVIGDVVNVAFRLENMTNRQEDLDLVMGCDAATHLLAPENFFKKYSFRVKGKQEAVEAYGCSFPQLSAYLLQNAGLIGTV